MKKIFLALMILAALCSCDKVTNPKGPAFSINEFFDSQVASYVWGNDVENIVVDRQKGAIYLDMKEGGRTAVLTYIIDEAKEEPGGASFHAHTPLKSDNLRYELFLLYQGNTDEEFQVRLTRYVYREGEMYPEQSSMVGDKLMPVSEYKPDRTDTYDFYVEIGGERIYVKYECSAFTGIVGIFAPKGTHEFVYAGLGKPEDFVGLDLKGKYAGIDRGEFTFNEKCKNAVAAGAEGVVFFGNSEDTINPDTSDFPDTPVVYVPQSVAEKFKNSKKKVFTYNYDVL